MKSIGIDLGTSSTIVYVKGSGIVLREPSVVAVDAKTRAVVAVGNQAKLMLGKTPGTIIAMRPLRDGVIAEFDLTTAMLRSYLKKVSGSTLFSRPKVAVCVPAGVTEVERRAVEDVTLDAGAQSVALIEEPVAAAFGSGYRIDKVRGTMVVDFGGGTTEVAVLSLGGTVLARSLRIGGDVLDEAIVNYLKRRFNVLIGATTAELLKKRIGSCHPTMDSGAMEVRGRNLMSGLPAVITVTSTDVREAMEEELFRIVDSIRAILESTPPELAADIYDAGIVLTGGGALMRGIDLLVSRATGIRTVIAKSPIDSVALGIGRMLDSYDDIGRLIKYRVK